MHRSAQQLVAQLSAAGMTFRSFTLTQEGRHTPADGEWNYLDVPHLGVVHHPLQSYSTHVTDGASAALNLQRLLGLTWPVCTYAYRAAPGTLTYYSTLFFFVLIVETKFIALEPGRTRVDTTYHFGSPRALSWLFPLVRRLLTKNNEFLMSGDVEMRERRGLLRRRGYSFREDREGLTFEGSLDIARTNVIAPSGGASSSPVRVPVARLRTGGDLLVGQDDHLGLRMVRDNGKLLVFPRLCPHAGASLDSPRCEGGRIRCPWHGRMFSALGTLDLASANPQSLRTPNHEVTLADEFLTVSPLTS